MIDRAYGRHCCCFLVDYLHGFLLQAVAASEHGGENPRFISVVVLLTFGVAGSPGFVRPLRDGVDHVVCGAAYLRELIAVIEIKAL